MKKKIPNGSLYFTQKNVVRPLGGGILILALLVIAFPLSWVNFVIAGVLCPVGLIMFWIGGTKVVSEKEMEEEMEKLLLDYDRPITERLDYESVILRIPAPFEVSAYDLGEAATCFKRNKGSTVISDRYVRTHFFLTNETLIIIGRRLSLTELENDAGVTDFSETYLRAGIRAELEERTATVKLTLDGRPATAKWFELVIRALDGEELLRLPVPNDLDITNLCETLNRQQV